MRLTTALLERTLAYRVWQAPFAARKLDPLVRGGDIGRARRVLDVGCGPGTNTAYFAHAEYLGIDINARYVADARRRHGRDFVVADVTTLTLAGGGGYDFVLANSFFHHVSALDGRRILAHLATLVADGGHLHVLDLVLPEAPTVARLLARWDRGAYARPLAEWRSLFTEAFEPVVLEPYPLGAFGVTLWQMVYFKGRPRR